MSALDAIRKLSADYETAHLAGDGQALARLFGDDAVIIPPGKPAIEGRKRIDEFFSGVTGGIQSRGWRVEVSATLVELKRGDLSRLMAEGRQLNVRSWLGADVKDPIL
jgi:uncharacterized protein (TIGR02246 family)